ncbi:baseplate J/gp47 family protein [Pseudoroseomonas cervicalis]|uniref:Baseplate J-like protein n=1 Tax=Pseudoroseomonas cervicalis ATCC 49957 TaxID=525371 RepID=D5RTE9_9PROT|nr:baseplate J/gp47 family protein [Pseudoroseomonas cervicalis]EFH09380.1 baseplate J-like protein [Pseudoroseomonas cervicalis ATCC 49957]
MPYERPTLTALVQQARNDAGEATGGMVLRASLLGILAKALAGLLHGVYGYLDWIARMAVPVTARDEYLAGWAALVGIAAVPPAAAAGTAEFTGTPGALLPEGTPVTRPLDGQAFRTTALGTVGSDGLVVVPVEAVEPGAAGNGASAQPMVISAAITGVNAAGIAASAMTGGADEEDQESVRSRMLARFQAPPQGGAERDYLAWALEVPGVTRAWVRRGQSPEVVVYVMLDDAQAAHDGFPQGSDGVASAETRGVPATGDQLAVADHVYPLRPVTALVRVVAPVPHVLDLEIGDLQVDSAATRAAIRASLIGMLRRKGVPGGTIYTSDITSAISAAAGVERFTLVEPVTSIVMPAGHLPVLGTIVWS